MYTVTVTESARRAIGKLPGNLQERLLRAAYGLADHPRPHGCTKLVGQQNLYRIRIGDYRIVYQIDDARRIVEIALAAHRRDVYRGL